MYFLVNLNQYLKTTVLLLILNQYKLAHGDDPLERKLAQVNNDFGLSIFSFMSTAHGNQAISPISLLSAFGILFCASAGPTTKMYEQFLKLKDHKTTEKELIKAFNLLHKLIITESKNKDLVQLNMINTVLAHVSLQLKKNFQETAETNFNANVYQSTFKNPGSLVKIVNDMIKNRTNNKIESLIDTKLNSNTVLMILNVVYFKGAWKYPFDFTDKKKSYFWNSRNEKEKIQYMSIGNKEMNYLTSTGILDAQVLEMPYKNENYSFVLMLPRNRHGLARLKLNFNYRHVMPLLKQMSMKRVNLFLPKFKFTQQYSMKKLLDQRLDRQLFDSDANFGRMTNKKNVVLDEILHKIVIDVNENGTEATASTRAGLVIRAREEEPKITFKAEHPFLYFITDRRTGIILFLGQVTHLFEDNEDNVDNSNDSKKTKKTNVEKISASDPEYDYDSSLIGKIKKKQLGLDSTDVEFKLKV